MAVSEDEQAKVERNRAKIFRGYGLQPSTVKLLAQRTDIHWTKVAELLEQGCDEQTMLDILL